MIGSEAPEAGTLARGESNVSRLVFGKGMKRELKALIFGLAGRSGAGGSVAGGRTYIYLRRLPP